ncbi:hypothetical protein [Candidatus Lucifugimonas marina]|uniref:hypothetical protein n=1 Tax=Candidatus Lucifugimonas marina TaxID=3038979 RepID=UPI00319E3CC3
MVSPSIFRTQRSPDSASPPNLADSRNSGPCVHRCSRLTHVKFWNDVHAQNDDRHIRNIGPSRTNDGHIPIPPAANPAVLDLGGRTSRQQPQL